MLHSAGLGKSQNAILGVLVELNGTGDYIDAWDCNGNGDAVPDFLNNNTTFTFSQQRGFITMECLGSGIEKLFPGATLRGDVVVQDDSDGSGPYVKYWDAEQLGPMPSLETLEAAGLVAEQEVAAERASDNSALEMVDDLLAKDPEDVTAAEVKFLVLKIAKYLRSLRL